MDKLSPSGRSILLVSIITVLAVTPAWAHEPVRTNFTEGHGFVPGGTDPAPYTHHIPYYDDYDHSVMDPVAVSDSQVRAFVNFLDGKGIDIMLPQTFDDLKYGAEATGVQLLANHPIVNSWQLGKEPQGALFTIIFPPKFQKNLQGGDRYPIVVLGLGHRVDSMNQEIFLESVDNLVPSGVRTVHDCYEATGKGVVFVYWNSGGTLCMGSNENARVAFNDMIQFLHLNYSCNKDRIIARGHSRGGFTSLTIAQNTVHNHLVEGEPRFDYNAIAVFSSASPLSLGKLAQLPVCNTSSFTSMWKSYFDPANGRYPYAYRYRDYYQEDPPHYPHNPPGYNNEFLYPIFEAQSSGYCDYVDKNCPDHPLNIEQLRGKFICLEYGTHDNYWPFPWFIDMDNALSNRGIEHTTIIRVGSGHGLGSNGASFTPDLQDIFEDYMLHLLTEGVTEPGVDYRTEQPHRMGLYDSARNYVIDDDPVDHDNHTRWFLDDLPFSATFPWVLGSNVFQVNHPNMSGSDNVANEPGVIFLSGPKNKKCSYSLNVLNSSGRITGTYTFDEVHFSESETAMVDWGIDHTSIHERGWEYDVRPEVYPFWADGHLPPDNREVNDRLVWYVTIHDEEEGVVTDLAPITDPALRYTNLGDDPDTNQRWSLETEIASRQGTTGETTPYNTGGTKLSFSFGLDHYVYRTSGGNSVDIPASLPLVPTLGCYPKSAEEGDIPVDIRLYPFIGNNEAEGKVIEYAIFFKAAGPDDPNFDNAIEYRVGLKGTDGERYNPNDETEDREFFVTANIDLPAHNGLDICDAYGYLPRDEDKPTRARAVHPHTFSQWHDNLLGTNTFILRVYELEVDENGEVVTNLETGEDSILSTTDAYCTFEFTEPAPE